MKRLLLVTVIFCVGHMAVSHCQERTPEEAVQVLLGSRSELNCTNSCMSLVPVIVVESRWRPHRASTTPPEPMTAQAASQVLALPGLPLTPIRRSYRGPFVHQPLTPTIRVIR